MSKQRMPTMSDVAAQAGVSLKTVSNVINDWPYITDETRQKVEQAIAAVGYRRNQLARSLVTGKSHSIGVVVPDLANPFFSTALRGCEDSLFGGYNLFVCNTNEDIAREQQSIRDLLSRSVDGLILWGTRISGEQLLELVGAHFPLVTVELSAEPIRPNHININVDNVTGGATCNAAPNQEWLSPHCLPGRSARSHYRPIALAGLSGGDGERLP